jgi:hypothetical protein
MHSLGKRANTVQLRVGDPTFADRVPTPQSSQRSSRFHKPALPRAALGIATKPSLCRASRQAIFGLQALMSDAAVF